MKQLSLFFQSPPASSAGSDATAQNIDAWELYVDGASRNNPGPSGVGMYIKKNGVPEYRQGYYLGKLTNNQAEYLALLLGLFVCIQQMKTTDTLAVFSDSQLMIRQLAGAYKVRNPQLYSLYIVAKQALQTINHNLIHIAREHNSVADLMANKGIDGKIPLPHSLRTMLEQHGISL